MLPTSGLTTMQDTFSESWVHGAVDRLLFVSMAWGHCECKAKIVTAPLHKFIYAQVAMESFAFPNKINSISTEIPQKCSKLYFFSLESGITKTLPLRFGLVLKEKRMNKKTKPHKQSLVVGDQNGIRESKIRFFCK